MSDQPNNIKLLTHLSLDGDDSGTSLVNMIAESVALDIVSGKHPPGTVLSSIMLAEKFQSSRTPVREAMLILESHGLVEIPARRQPRVASIDRQSIRETYTIQAELLRTKFELSARNANEADLLDMRAMYQEMCDADASSDDERYFWGNIGFHDAASRASKNMTLVRILDSLRLRTLQTRRIVLSQPDRRANSLSEHGHILSACERGEAALAGAIVHSLYSTALRILEQIFDETEAERPASRRRSKR